MRIHHLAFVLAALCGACGSSPDELSAFATASKVVATPADVGDVSDIAGAYSGGPDAQFDHLVLDLIADDGARPVYFLESKASVISCSVSAGCTLTHERENGTYSATATQLVLEPASGPVRAYDYVRSGDTLTLTASGTSGSYTTIVSYCDVPADCPGEGVIRPQCVSATSGWQCASNACSFACWK